jgi:hypothetical protein
MRRVHCLFNTSEENAEVNQYSNAPISMSGVPVEECFWGGI